MNWYVYIIETSDDKLYTGITTDIKRRWQEHFNSVKGAKFFRGRKPKRLVFLSPHPDRSAATKAEIAIKKLTRSKKLALSNIGIVQIDDSQPY